MKSRRLSAIALLFATAALVAPSVASAQLASFISSTCGAGCSDPVGEEGAARQNWSALQQLGTTQWIGASYGSGTVTAAGLLAASRVVGATELDRYLRTGQSSDASTAALVQSSMAAASAIDVTAITGTAPAGRSLALAATAAGAEASAASAIPAAAAASLGSALSGAVSGNFYGPGLGGSSGYCDNSIANAQNAGAQQYINNMVNISTSGEYGFSQLGGVPISAGQRSQSGFYGTSCLERLMQGSRDLLFKPPQLSTLLSMLGSMFGGSGGNSCNNAPSVLNQVMQSMPNGMFGNAGAGGFFPYLGYSAGESNAGMNLNFSNGFNLLSAVPSASAPKGAISSLFSR